MAQIKSITRSNGKATEKLKVAGSTYTKKVFKNESDGKKTPSKNKRSVPKIDSEVKKSPPRKIKSVPKSDSDLIDNCPEKKKSTPKPRTNKRKVSTKNRKNKDNLSIMESVDFIRVVRLAFLSLVMGFIILQYYLVTENKFIETYIGIWNRKNILFPVFLFVSYTLGVFFIGFKAGKRRYS
ncbi:hypothetical protein MZM54_04075 [[Brevibacterium] frigoritolerans]|nr:hypothetical protein [Peribacillus frigoritolerans]